MGRAPCFGMVAFPSWLLFALLLLAPLDALGASYAEVKAHLKSLSERYPEQVQLISVGDSDSGELIQGVKIGHGPIRNLVVAAHHGNEYGSTEVARAFAEDVAKAPIVGQSVFVVPVLNIGGYNAGSRRERAGGATYDPNRDYPGPCGGEGPFRLKSTASLARFIEREEIVASATLHTYMPGVLYPWGVSTQQTSTRFDGIFLDLGRALAIESRYPVGNSTKLLYPADGTFEDYAFWRHGIWSLLAELGHSHSPSSAAVKEMIRLNVPGLRRMFEQAPTRRAEQHSFEGTCDPSARVLDRHDE